MSRKWWDVYTGENGHLKSAGSRNSDGRPAQEKAAVIGGVLQGAYWRAAVANAYGTEVDKVSVYTVGIDDSASSYAVLDPRSYIGDGKALKTFYDKVNGWKMGSTETITVIDGTNIGYDGNPPSLGRSSTQYIYDKPTADESDECYKTYRVTASQLDFLYTKQYFPVTNSDELADAFGQIFTDFTSNLFVPVSGSNDLGVSNSITYRDPVGKYMDVKDVKGLSLFGTYYPITETATYSYEFNKAYEDAKGGSFTSGWYKGDAENAEYADYEETEEKEGDRVPAGHGYQSAEDAWENGWVYRLSDTDAKRFVPTLDTGGDTEKQRNTEYTFYRLHMKDVDRRKLRMNPVYGDKVPEGVNYDGEGLAHLNTPGVYSLDDLRIWVEDSGDYSDNDPSLESDTNFDEALYINLPGNMVPLRTVTISQDSEKGSWSYETNLPSGDSVAPDSKQSASFPLRVYYTVGIADSVLTTEGDIDVANGISAEYIQDNKVQTTAAQAARALKQNDVEFFSNWYNPENRYSDYATTSTEYSYGDPVVTFSPGTDNRYYIFQKSLPLYSTAYVFVEEAQADHGGKWRLVKINEEASGDAVTYTPAEFGGEILARDLEPDGLQEEDVSDTIQDKMWEALRKRGITEAENGDIVLLKNHRLTDVEQKDGQEDPFSADNYYYMGIEYYVLGKDGAATQVEYALARKGSEFGSAYKAAGISNGDMLCWYDASGTVTDTYPYLSRTETQDASRGRDYIGLTQDDLESLYVDGKIDKSKFGADLQQKVKDVKDKEGTEWVVAAKVGGLRVGALAQAVGEKTKKGAELNNYPDYANERFEDRVTVQYYEGNTTRTANNYYVPTISRSSDISSDDVVVNVYLGNNGRLWVNDTLLLVSKRLEAGPGGLLPDNSQDKDFDFQVTIKGFTGAREGVRVRYNEATKAWQRQLHYIDMELNNKLFLQNSDGSMTMVDSEGCRVTGDETSGYTYAEDCKSAGGAAHKAGDPYDPDDPDDSAEGLYYVYIGSPDQDNVGGSNTALRVYHNPFCTANADQNVATADVRVLYRTRDEQGHEKEEWYNGGSAFQNYTGKAEFYAVSVDLVPIDVYSAEEDWSAENVRDEQGKKTLKDFYLTTLDPTGAESSDIVVTSPYRTQSTYLTETAYFGYDAEVAEWLADTDARHTLEDAADYKLDEDELYDQNVFDSSYKNKSEIAENTAEIRLKSGWGLLFAGMDSSTAYRLSERLDEEDFGEGYDFLRVQHVQQESSHEYKFDDERFTGSGHVYSINGDTGTNEEAGHYVNTWSTDKSETHINDEDVEPSEEGGSTYPGVQVGDEITYEIKWYNNAADTSGYPVDAAVSIEDPLDGGVDFVSAEFDGVKLEAVDGKAGCKTAQTVKVGVEDKPLISYSGEKGGHTVTWNLGSQKARANGIVKLTVRVNENAKAYWDYDVDDSPDGNDFRVHNRATVRVADNAYHTNTVTNPVGEPDKTETQIEHEGQNKPVQKDELSQKENADNTYEGPLVYVGDKITYEISWRNYESEDALITLRDPLDENVKFISAEFDPNDVKDEDGKSIPEENQKPVKDKLTLEGKADSDGKAETVETSDKTTNYGTAEKPDDRKVIRYDADKHEVVWNLGFQPVGSSGKVTLVVEVLSTATPAGHVDNTAYVQVNHDAEQQTKTVENPTPEQHKTETQVADKTVGEDDLIPDENGRVIGPNALVGKKIVYEIDWENYKGEAAAVTITDPLDPGVDFVSAGFDPADTLAPDPEEPPRMVPVTPDSEGYKGAQKAELEGMPDAPAGKESTVKVDVPKQDEPGQTESKPVITYRIKASDPDIHNEGGHTVTWNLGVQPAGAKGKVTLVVRVNAEAVTGTGNNEVENTGYVQVGNDAQTQTETVVNPVYPVKEEITPDAGDQAGVGDEITYRVFWQNYEAAAAAVTVEDQLDAGVDFVSASFDPAAINPKTGTDYKGAKNALLAGNPDAPADAATDDVKVSVPAEDDLGTKEEPVIAYNAGKHTVTWNLGEQAKMAEGYVELTVRVNKNAVNDWQYGAGDVPQTGGGEDHEVVNRASVKVGNHDKVYTNVVENPVPEKTETAVGGKNDFTITPNEGSGNTLTGPGVNVGEEITYEIAWKNGYDKKADVTITDTLDSGVDFVGALAADREGNPVTDELTADRTGRTLTQNGVTLSYYKEGTDGIPAHTVVWTLKEQPAGSEGKVVLRVRVNENARTAEVVDNQAVVQVGGSSAVTDIVENPLGGPEKTETSVKHNNSVTDVGTEHDNLIEDENGVWNGPLVFAGDEITYKISWENYENDTATVVIRDPLDPNVEFVEAIISENEVLKADGSDSTDGAVVYDSANHTVIWTLKDQIAGASGEVKLTVKVKEDAVAAGHVDNTADVKVGNHPEQKTDTMRNPTPDVHKTEPDPGDGERVLVGQELTYEITWENYKPDSAKVVIYDELDEGVDFKQAAFNGTVLNAADEKDGSGNITVTKDNITITYYANADPGKGVLAHTVVWELNDRSAGDKGKVVLKVTTNGKAVYKEEGGSNKADGEVENDAQVQVGTDNKVSTELVTNPLTPDKEEVSPGDKMMAGIGDEITYRIYWQNYHDEPAAVVVEDPLDIGVDFVKAVWGNLALNANSAGTDTATDGDTSHTPRIAYTKADHTVAWYLGEQPALKDGYVDLTVKVNEKAARKWEYGDAAGAAPDTPVTGGGNDYEVVDRASVQVGNDGKIYTDIVENPVPDKTETQIQHGGDTITITEGGGAPMGAAVLSDEAAALVPAMDEPKAAEPGTANQETAEPETANQETAESETVEGTETEPETEPEAGEDSSVEDQKAEDQNQPETGISEAETQDDGQQSVQIRAKAVPLAGSSLGGMTAEAGQVDPADTGTEENGSADAEETAAEDTELQTNPKGTETEGVEADDSESEIPDGISPADQPAGQRDAGVMPIANTAGALSPSTDPEKPNTWDGPLVFVGDEITYKIGWRNAYDVPADVVITDKLDDGVDFVSASYNDVTLAAEGRQSSGNVTVIYDKGSHTVTWVLSECDPDTAGEVTLVVRVNEYATPQGLVDNKATVQVGNDTEDTRIIENPTPEMEKEELNPGEGQQVMSGDYITYRIKWQNYETDLADVIIRDQLDPGVTFVSASVEPPYEGDAANAPYDPDTAYGYLKDKDTRVLKAEAADAARIDADEELLDMSVPADAADTVTDAQPSEDSGVQEGDTSADPEAGTSDPSSDVPGTEQPSESLKDSESTQPSEETDIPAEIQPADGTEDQDEKQPAAEDGTLAAPEASDEAVGQGNAGLRISSPGSSIITTLPEDGESEGANPETGVQPDAQTDVQTGTDEQKDKTGADSQNSQGDTTVQSGADIQDAQDSPDEQEASNADPAASEDAVMPVATGYDEVLMPGLLQDCSIYYDADGNKADNKDSSSVAIEYSATTGTVTWTLKQRRPEDSGWVYITVQVNDDADKDYTYEAGNIAGGMGNDKQVLNQAGVTVGNNSEILTQVVENPLEPQKSETEVNDVPLSPRELVADENGNIDGPEVHVGDTITYTITWQNNQSDPAEVVITDLLDPGVDFVEASDKGAFDTATHKVTWNLGVKQPGDRGMVTLRVRVNANAKEKWDYDPNDPSKGSAGSDDDNMVRNQAQVTVGNTPQVTNKVENPVKDAGGLIVYKTVDGNRGDRTKAFHFTVTLTGDGAESVTGSYGDMIFVNGKANITLKHGENRKAQGLPPGLGYNVTEEEAGQDGYVTQPTGDTGTIPENDMAEARFVNTKNGTPPPPDDHPHDPHDPDEPENPENPENPPIPPSMLISPPTGDDSNWMLWLAVIVMAAAGICVSVFVLRKQPRRRRQHRRH